MASLVTLSFLLQFPLLIIGQGTDGLTVIIIIVLLTGFCLTITISTITMTVLFIRKKK